MSNFDRPKPPGNPFQGGRPRIEPGAGREARVLHELQRMVESAPSSLAAEVRLPISLPGIKGELVGRLTGTPLVRAWECYSPRFKAEMPISTGLSFGSRNNSSVTNWKQAVHDLGKPTSVTPTWDRADVVWEKGTDQLKASLSSEQLIDAKVPVEVSGIRSKKEYSGESLNVVAELEFADIGTLKEVKLGRGEQSGGSYIAPASLTKVGAGLSESDQKEIVAQLRSTRKELPVYNAESKLELARRSANEFPLNDLLKQMSIVGMANSVTVQTERWSSNEAVTAHYGDERWGTGNYMKVDHQQRHLLCDGVRVNLPESNGTLGGAFSRTGDAVARAFLEWGSSYMERSLEKLKEDLEKVNLKYYGVPDPAIYGDFDEQASNPAEDAARKSLETILNELNARVEKARAAAMLGMERTDPAKAEEKLSLLPGFSRRYQEASKSIKDENLDKFSDKSNESEYAVRKLLLQADKDAKAKDFLAVSSALPEIQKAIEHFEQIVIEARAARKVYFERKATLQTNAGELNSMVTSLQADERSQKAEIKQERERTQAEKLGAALAEKARALLGRDQAILIIQGELDAPYGRGRRQAALSSAIGGATEDMALNELYSLSKAAVLDEAMAHAIDILTNEPVPPVPPAKKTEQDKPPEAPAKPADLSTFDTNKLFGGRGNKPKNK